MRLGCLAMAVALTCGCGQNVTNMLVDPDAVAPMTEVEMPAAEANITTGVTMTVSHLDDVYEPNDTVAEATDLGTAPVDVTVQAFLDARHVLYTAQLENQGSAPTKDFYVDLFRNREAAPQVPGEGDAWKWIDDLAVGQKLDVEFVVENVAPGTYESWVMADSLDEVKEKDESDNSACTGPFEVGEDVDVFEFHQDAGYGIDIQIDQLPADYDVELYQGGELVAGSYQSGTDAESIQVSEAPATADYHLIIYSYDGALDSSQPYRLRLALP